MWEGGGGRAGVTVGGDKTPAQTATFQPRFFPHVPTVWTVAVVVVATVAPLAPTVTVGDEFLYRHAELSVSVLWLK